MNSYGNRYRFTLFGESHAPEIGVRIEGLRSGIPIDQAAGQICADLTLSCPPGIPVTVCGEIITDESIAMLKHYKIPEIEVLSGS